MRRLIIWGAGWNLVPNCRMTSLFRSLWFIVFLFFITRTIHAYIKNTQSPENLPYNEKADLDQMPPLLILLFVGLLLLLSSFHLAHNSRNFDLDQWCCEVVVKSEDVIVTNVFGTRLLV